MGEHKTSEQSSRAARVMFLLGAGASYDAGLPLLGQLTSEIEKCLPDDLRRLYRELLHGTLPEHERRTRNIEDVLTAADGLASARLDRGHSLPRDFSILAHEVRKRIWDRLRGTQRKTGYLQPLQRLAHRHSPLSIASLNNDLVIESWASKQRLPLSRGFDARGSFHRSLLAEESPGIHLLKLHGSVDWSYAPEKGLQQFRGPFRNSSGMLTLRSPLPDVAVVFPSRLKVLQALPLRELLLEFDRRLLQASLLIIVGCQLGDSHITEAIVEGCRENPDLKILIVDPQPESSMGNLRRGSGKLELGYRMDAMPCGFEEALEGNRLQRRIERMLDGELSIGRKLILGVEDTRGRGAQGVGRLSDLADSLDHHSGLEAEEVEEARRLIGQRVPPGDVRGRIPSLLREIRDALEVESDRSLVPIRNTLTRAMQQPSPPTGSHLVNHDQAVYVLARNCIQKIEIKGDPLAIAMTKVTEDLGDTSGLAIHDREAVLFRKPNLFRTEGLRRLMSVNLQSGRVRNHWLIRQGQAGIWSALRFLVAHIREQNTWLPSREGLKQAALIRGWLNWPTSLQWMPDGSLLVVESRRVNKVAWPSGRVMATSGDRFLNLCDVAVSRDGTTVYLLEGGVEREGRLLAWQPEAEQGKAVTSLLVPLRHPGGLALDPAETRLLVTISEAGTVLSIPLAGPTEIGLPRVIVRNLIHPRWLCSNGEEGWFVSTQLGILWFLDH